MRRTDLGSSINRNLKKKKKKKKKNKKKKKKNLSF